MKTLTYSEIRKKYIEFMTQNGHVEIPGAPLVPENDPSILFINAGMTPLVPFLLGEKHPAGKKLANVQRCIRTTDIDEVGNAIHCTAFEMLGNWSLNDYFKKEAIKLTVDFFTEVLGLDFNNIYASAFAGEKDIPKDEESIKIWKAVFKEKGIAAKEGKGEKIQLYGRAECWWELEAGGPCGPCSEIFYDTGKKACGPDCHINCNCGKYVELGNNVFMEYLKKDGKYSPLGRHNVDFGGGLERQVMLFQGKDNYFETDIYLPILKKVQELSQTSDIHSQRIIVDHIKSATWIMMDGVTPGRTEQSYILRRLIRRAVRHGRKLQIDGNFTRTIGQIAIDQFAPIYPDLKTQEAEILDVMEEEENRFRKTIQSGMKKFISLKEKKGEITGKDAFYLYETYGFPVEITRELAEEENLSIDLDGYQKALEKHQKKSRAAAKDFFKGGLADTTEKSTKYHTATHLLNAALRKVLGDHIHQKGSNINPERLRFDFSHDSRLTDEEAAKVEDLVNEQIKKKLPITFKEMPKEQALKIVPDAMFADKYGNTVKVYFIGQEKDPFSTEICGGPHVKNTGELGHFKIIKQESVGAGVRRIKAVLE